MSLIKGLSPEVAKEVGKSAAIMLQQLIQWFKSKPVEKVYRTNDEMFEDLNGVLSIATIQRCKQRLIDNGYVVVTFDKGLNRTTHYKLTEKGKALLDASKQRQEAITAQKAKPATSVQQEVKTAYKAKYNANTKQSCGVSESNNALEHNSAMKASFEKGFTNSKAIPMPESVRNLFKKKEAAKVDSVAKVEEACDLEWEAVVAAEMELQAESISAEDYADAEIAMLQAIEFAETKPEPKMSLSDLMKTAYSKAATEAQELMYAMKQDAMYFAEDF